MLNTTRTKTRFSPTHPATLARGASYVPPPVLLFLVENPAKPRSPMEPIPSAAYDGSSKWPNRARIRAS